MLTLATIKPKQSCKLQNNTVSYQQLEDLLQNELIEPVDFRKIVPYLKLHAAAKDTVRN